MGDSACREYRICRWESRAAVQKDTVFTRSQNGSSCSLSLTRLRWFESVEKAPGITLKGSSVGSYLWESCVKVFLLGPGSQTRRWHQSRKRTGKKKKKWDCGLSDFLAPWSVETLIRARWLWRNYLGGWSESERSHWVWTLRTARFPVHSL